MKRSLVVLSVMIMVILAPAAWASDASSWMLLTEREWGPEIFGFASSPGEMDLFFLGAEKRWSGRFSGFVGVEIDDRDLPGFRESRSMLAGFSFDAAPGISISLEFQEAGMENAFDEPEDRVVTFRTVITF